MSEELIVVWTGAHEGADRDLFNPVDWDSPRSPDIPMNLSKRAGRPSPRSKRYRPRQDRRWFSQADYAAMREQSR